MSSESNPEIAKRLELLTPAQRKLLEQRLMERRVAVAARNVIPPREQNGPAELSYAQELLYLLTQVFDDGIAYNAPGAFHLAGPLDLGVLARALEALTERHAILRTKYSAIDGKPMQLVGPVVPVQINVVDLRSLPPDERQAESQRILKDESRYRFDLVNGPVMRPTVILLAETEHILMLNMHHIATDGYSRTAIYRDLTALYDAFVKELPAPLEPLRIQYADYAVWHRRWLDQGVADSQLEYWKRKLHGAPSRLDLPTDFPRPPVRSWVGDNISMMFDVSTREALRAAARREDGTLFVAMLATFAILLARYSGQDDIVIGTPFAGRNRTELQSMVGYFINPLALRLDLSGDPTFAELLARARQTTVEAFAHADIPYETVVRAINPQRDMSQTPVFQAMLVFHNPAWQTERPKFEPEGIRCAEISHERGWSKFDLLVGSSERTTGMNTTWEYSTELFTDATVKRMMEHFRTLAESAGASPHRRLSQLSMLSEAERAKVVVAWNAKPAKVPDAPIFKDLFEARVKERPDAAAVVVGDHSLTYGQLNRRSNQVAWLLRERGVRPETLVGVLMEKSPDLIPAVLGVLKAGGAYIPLDPQYPADRVEFMVQDAQPKLVLTQEKHLAGAPSGQHELIALDAPGSLDGWPEENPPTVAGGDDLAYVNYTSGSTGRPKGVMIANRSVASLYFAHERGYRLSELSAHAQLASFSFDVFAGDLVRSLLSGAKLVLCPLETVVDPAALYALTIAEGIDAAEFVPATASLLFEYVQREGKTLEHMRLVIVGSETWRNDQYVFFKGLCGPHTRLLNSYGVTEATIDSTSYEPPPDAELVPGRFVSIGKPIDNTNVYVLDKNLEPQPIGIAGELCLGGPAVARGYLNRPDLTAEKFVPDPFSDEPGALLYRTGDLSRWLPDRTIDFLGRTDRQIKIRGFRIEPGEIESVLESRPEIRSAAVIDRLDPRGEPRLVAYVQALRELPDPADLRAHLSEHVPNYMVPSNFVAVDDIPATPNGKTDFDALPEPQWDGGPSDELVAPRTEAERAVAAIWSEVLAVESIGIHDNFFALGGHSLVAMRVMSRVRDELGVALTLRAIFDFPTVAELAAELERSRQTDAEPEAPALVRVDRARYRAGATPGPRR
jgi:amino acid adenylation domain-containing protein